MTQRLVSVRMLGNLCDFGTCVDPTAGMANELRDKGIEIANDAVSADQAGNYEDAITKYCKAAEYLLTALSQAADIPTPSPLHCRRLGQRHPDSKSKGRTSEPLLRQSTRRTRSL